MGRSLNGFNISTCTPVIFFHYVVGYRCRIRELYAGLAGVLKIRPIARQMNQVGKISPRQWKAIESAATDTDSARQLLDIVLEQSLVDKQMFDSFLEALVYVDQQYIVNYLIHAGMLSTTVM